MLIISNCSRVPGIHPRYFPNWIWYNIHIMCKQNHTYIKITICSSISYLLGSHFENGGHFEFENTRNRFLDQNTLEFMYWLTICVNFQRIYGILCILIKLQRSFCFRLIISNYSRVTAIHLIYLSYRIYWQTKSIAKKKLLTTKQGWPCWFRDYNE